MPSGKYTIGLGQQGLAFCGDREDAVSMALTACKRLLEKHNVSPLEVRGAAATDRSPAACRRCCAACRRRSGAAWRRRNLGGRLKQALPPAACTPAAVPAACQPAPLPLLAVAAHPALSTLLRCAGRRWGGWRSAPRAAWIPPNPSKPT